jgi:hypothetical protein
MKRKIHELPRTDISPLFFHAGRSNRTFPAVSIPRGRSLLLPAAAGASILVVGLALLPVAFVMLDHNRVVSWTNALFDLAGL